MDIELIDYSKNYLDILYLAGRGCHGLEFLTSETIELKKDFVKKLVLNKHESVLEHGIISIFIKGCSRSFMSQLTRHRLVSFSVKSQHYVDYSDFEFKDLETKNSKVNDLYEVMMEDINQMYKYFVQNCEIPIYVAREILPNSCLTNIFMTTNFREWRYIIHLRQSLNNTPEIRDFTSKVLKIFNKIVPEVFEDL